MVEGISWKNQSRSYTRKISRNKTRKIKKCVNKGISEM
jgi:hypothetical protein